MLAWVKKNVDKGMARSIFERHSCDPLAAYILAGRGIVSDDAIPFYLSDDISLLRDPLTLPDMQIAVKRIIQAKAKNEKVLIFGDRDVDGITATVMLFEYLQCLGIDVSWSIPTGDETYGLSIEAVEGFAAIGGNLIVTVDCGISSIKEISRANELGLSVIVTDHHMPKKELPDAAATVNPKLPHSTYPFHDICGCAVAYKLVAALQDKLCRNAYTDSIFKEAEYLQLAALGTIADIVPLKDENRIIARKGLSAINKNPRKGIAELLLVMGLSGKPITAEELAWLLCPAVNSAGRMGCPEKAVNLLLEGDAQKRFVLAKEIKSLNEKRRRLGAKTLPIAEELAIQNLDRFSGKLFLAAGEEISRGITGVIANRLIEKHHIPAMVVHLNGNLAIGSIRSPGNYDIRLLLEPLDDLLLNYGGHEGVLGFSMARSLWGQYLDRLEIEMESILPTAMPHEKPIEVDAELPPDFIAPGILNLVGLFEPYGAGNKPLLFASFGLKVLGASYLGRREPKHLKFILDAGKYKWPAILWNGKDKAGDGIIAGDRVDLLYTFNHNWHGGIERPQIIIIDICKSAVN